MATSLASHIEYKNLVRQNFLNFLESLTQLHSNFENVDVRGVEAVDEVTANFSRVISNMFDSESENYLSDFMAKGLDTLIPFTKPRVIKVRRNTDIAMNAHNGIPNLKVRNEINSMLMRDVILTEYDESSKEVARMNLIGSEHDAAIMAEFRRRMHGLYPIDTTLADEVIDTIFANDAHILRAIIDDYHESLPQTSSVSF
jgi:hypothetical protein